jgi:hypothetical protein
MPTQKPRKPRLTDESNFRGDLLEEGEKRNINEQLEETSMEEDLSPSNWNVHPTRGTTKMSGNMIDPTEWGLGDIPEPEVLEDGEEVKVTIISVREASTKDGNIPYYRITLEVSDQPLVKDILHQLYKVREDQSAKQKYNTKYIFQQFMRAFSLDMSQKFNPEIDWLGESAWCIVSMKESSEYGKQNQIRKWILPK